MRATSPEESCHVMRPEALEEAGAYLCVAERDGDILGIGALAAIDAGAGELKSMHTAQEARGQGVARAILQALIDHARAEGLSSLSLETGSQEAFAAARALYAAHGFAFCPPFGAYVEDPLSVFMTRAL